MAFVFLAAGLWAFSSHGAICDELCHYYEGIEQILRGNFVTPACFSTFPGYHLASAGVMKVLGLTTLFHARIVTSLWGLALALVAYAGARERSQGERLTRALLVFTMPLIAPYYFLTYTDTFAVLLSLAAFVAFDRKSDIAATALGAAAVYTRQTQVVWLGFFILMAFMDEGVGSREALKRATKRSAGFFLILALFGAWALHHGGFSVGVPDVHPNFKLTLGNIWFFLGLLPLVFLPYVFESASRLLSQLRRRWTGWIVAIPVLYTLFVLTFRVDHQFNAIVPEFFASFLHNQILHWSVQNHVTETLSFIPVLLGVWLLWDWPFREARFRWILPLYFALLSQQWLIEQRYYMPLFAFLVLTRKTTDPLTERTQLVWQVVLSALAVWGMARDIFLL
jgi:hypothetical protein